MAEDIAKLKERVDLAALVAEDLGQPSKRRGRWLMWVCPFHEDRDPSFGVTSDTGRYKCFGCGEAGDHLDWLEKRRNLTTKAAISELRRLAGLAETKRPSAPVATSSTPNGDPPGEKWQDQARAFMAWAAGQLWTDAGKPGLAYLCGGGLTEETIRRYGLGWCPGGSGRPAAEWGLEGKPIWLPPGVVIPCQVAGVVWYCKVRRFEDGQAAGKNKYPQVTGSRPALFGADDLRADGRPLLLCEGERDALLAMQELGDLVDVASLGGASQGLGRWALWLLPYKRILAAYDPDNAGRNGATNLEARSGRVKALQVPHGADLTDFHAAGGDLRAWLRVALDGGDPQPTSSTPSKDTAEPPLSVQAQQFMAAVGPMLRDWHELGDLWPGHRVSLEYDCLSGVPTIVGQPRERE